ncbi:unnamed protein product [Symbiodinium natans]|uniref:Nucleotide-diphospho-sugar transferase domain-containing protein n=1 Tax=Symbiodinium natans TaxID=878477 RepID=A0A812QFI8_9DINO|nr:unnamed protein product [Symbiodinium natans]
MFLKLLPLLATGFVGCYGVDGVGTDLWTNFLIFDHHYLPMAKCWFQWFKKSASARPLQVGCMDGPSCAEAELWRQSLQNKVGGMNITNVLNPSQVEQTWVDMSISTEGEMKLVQPHPGHRQMIRSEVSTGSDFPRGNYIQMYHKMLWDSLSQKNAVLHLDVDALWLRSPDSSLARVLEQFPDADIISSSSTEWDPKKISDKWGFVLNVGFIMYRNTERVRELFEDDLLSVPTEKQSCQVLLNFALDRRGCQWSGSSLENRVGICGGIKVIALPQTFVSRATDLVYNPEDPTMPIIAHPDTGLLHLTGINRMEKFRKMGLCT